MVANWKLEQERTEVLVNEYYELFKEVGSDRFHQTVSVLIKEGPYKFFPTINEFRGWIPKAPTQAFCGKCESGWVRRPDYSARRLYRNETATMMVRCECRGGQEHPS